MPYGLGELKPFMPFSSLISGVGAGEQLQASGLKRQAAQMELNREKEMAGALQEYKQTNDPSAFKGVNPELAIKLQDHLDQQTPEALKGYEKAANFIQKSRGGITPENWPSVVDAIEKQGWVPPGTFPKNVNAQRLNQFMYAAEYTKAHIDALKAKPTVHDFGSSTGEGTQPMQYVPGEGWVPVGPPKHKEYAPRETPDEAGAKEEARQKVKEKYGTGAGNKYGFPQFKADYIKEHPDASNDEVWDAFKSGGKIGKVYSLEDQNKVLLDKVMSVINGPPPNKIRKEWEAADPTGKQEILKREMDVMRPAVFPDSAGKKKGGSKQAQVQHVPDPATNKDKFMQDPSGKWFKSDGVKWEPVRTKK